MKSTSHPTSPPPRPPRPGAIQSKSDKAMAENNTTWSSLLKQQPKPEQQRKPKPQLMPQPMPQSVARPMPHLEEMPQPEAIPQPMPQPEAMPQLMPQPEPEPRQVIQLHTAVERIAWVPDKLPEEYRQVVMMLRSLMNTLRILLNNMHTPSARSAMQVLDALNSVLATLE
ncbi:uncharacterized protein UU046-like [Dermacentor albipictus]|uniref:uncharacterized protein UU046-like n=1 Tax=Dermacentor albipictus TaxID=60249 RepID=UPI0038FCAFC7